MNQEQVADLLNVTKQTYSDIENGKTQKINPLHKRVLMEEFNLSEEELEDRHYQGYLHQVRSTYAVDNKNINMLDKELLDMLKEEQRKNSELHITILEQSKQLTEIMGKLIAKIG